MVRMTNVKNRVLPSCQQVHLSRLRSQRDIPRENRNCKGCLGLFAIPHQRRIDWRATALGDVPGRPRLRMGWIAHIRTGLVVDGHRPDGSKACVNEEGYQWVEDGADEHDAFAEEQEHGEHGHNDIEICRAIIR